MNKILRYGMVGGGPGSFIGDAHRRAIALDSTAQLVAGVFSSHPEKSRQTAQELGVDPARCYADYREMAEKEAARDDGIDFVVVVTPNVSHYEICKAFLNAGIHVSCDKPVTVTYAQAAELEALAKEKGLLFMVTYTYTGHVTTKYARDLWPPAPSARSGPSWRSIPRGGWPMKTTTVESRASGAAIRPAPAASTAWATWALMWKTSWRM